MQPKKYVICLCYTHKTPSSFSAWPHVAVMTTTHSHFTFSWTLPDTQAHKENLTLSAPVLTSESIKILLLYTLVDLILNG